MDAAGRAGSSARARNLAIGTVLNAASACAAGWLLLGASLGLVGLVVSGAILVGQVVARLVLPGERALVARERPPAAARWLPRPARTARSNADQPGQPLPPSLRGRCRCARW